MTHADFVHLRIHSAYSLSEGAVKIKQLVELCRRHAMPAVAVADSGNLFGAFQFAQVAADAGVQPIIACQLGLLTEDDLAEALADCRHHLARAGTSFTMYTVAQVWGRKGY